MLHGAIFMGAAQAVDASADAVGATGATVAVVAVLLGVVAMFAMLFWTKWAPSGGDPTGVVEQQRRNRLHQNPAYSG